MKFNGNDYLEASGLRIETARRLYNIERYSAAVYFAGVSIECLLRAFVVRENPQFDSGHDLRELYKTSQLEAFIRPKKRRDAAAWLGDIFSRWKNNYRFASDDRLKTEYKKLKNKRSFRNADIKENTRIVVNAAYELRAMGERRWRSKKT